MIKNILKINDSKTEYIIFRSPQCIASISVGVIFYEWLTLDASQKQ